MSENNQEFPDGLIFKLPSQNAPDFVKGSLSIKRKDLGNWLRQKEDDWINLDLKVSKGGKAYASVSTWKPDASKASAPSEPAPATPQGGSSFEDDSIPFSPIRNAHAI